MGTRSGDLDPAVVLYLMVTEDYRPHEMDTLLNKQSGLEGLSGHTSDMKTLLEEADAGNESCREAIDVFCHRLQKYIGAYHGFLNGADAIIFTGGIGSNSPDIREQSLEGMDNLGIELDPEKNRSTVGTEGFIEDETAASKIGVIPTEEELVIARDTVRCVQESNGTNTG